MFMNGTGKLLITLLSIWEFQDLKSLRSKILIETVSKILFWLEESLALEDINYKYRQEQKVTSTNGMEQIMPLNQLKNLLQITVFRLYKMRINLY